MKKHRITVEMSEDEFQNVCDGWDAKDGFYRKTLLQTEPFWREFKAYRESLSPKPLERNDAVCYGTRGVVVGGIVELAHDWLVYRDEKSGQPYMVARRNCPSGVLVKRDGTVVTAPWPEAK